MSENRHPPTIPTSFLVRFGALVERFGVRGLERLSGANKATISRLNRGFIPDLGTAQFAGQMTGVCPCCGKPWNTPKKLRLNQFALSP